jgi:hypothetical protein
VSQRDWEDAHLINAAVDIHADDPASGYRFIADELRERGITAGENRVARLCSHPPIAESSAPPSSQQAPNQLVGGPIPGKRSHRGLKGAPLIDSEPCVNRIPPEEPTWFSGQSN